MATQGTYLVNNTVNDCNALLLQLEGARRLVTRIVERMGALGTAAADSYTWPEGYTKADFLALYQALSVLPGSIVSNDVRNQIFKLVSSIQ